MKKMKEIKNIIMNIPNVEKLKRNGMIVGKNFYVQRGCVIDTSHCWLIRIGNDVTLGPGVHILAHDASTKHELGGNNVVIGANSVVTNDIPDNSVSVGIPCKVIGDYKSFVKKNEKLIEKKPKFDGTYTIRGGIDNTKKNEMISLLEKYKIGFVE